jgi:general secretion pathway protein D
MASPIYAVGKKGEKNFKEGLKHAAAEQWDKAAEEFALAVAARPKDTEYRLHYQRAVFNASQMFVQRGNSQAEQKDYAGAYNAYRRAYAYDPTNELAKSLMEKMLRLQQAQDEAAGKPAKSADGLQLVKTSYKADDVKNVPYPQILENHQNYRFPDGFPLREAIKQLADELELNIIFDRGSQLQDRKFGITLKDVSAARALDYIFRQEGLFFQKIGPKTIIVADQNRRQFFQELVLRTFYLANAEPKKILPIIQQAIPVQPGRTQTAVQVDEATNSVTVRDTEENIRLIGRLIKSLDKDRAEVVMDVNIYEVKKSDLLEFGNQIGTSEASLRNLGGISRGPGFDWGDVRSLAGGPLAAALVVPGSSLSALQKKSNSKLLASTQVHAFNNEESSARIGQRVPVRSAQFFPGTGTGGGNSGIVGDVIQFEQVGLTLKFTPIVFPNQDVQVKMSIESKDVTDANTLTPRFTERSISGTARIQNNRTLLLASVAQDSQSKSRTSLPLLGLIPIFGRLFSVPVKDNNQTDIVISVTPRVLRAPVITDEDEEIRNTGSVVSPTSGSLEAMIVQEEQDRYLAAARRLPANARVQLPDQQREIPNYVPAESKSAEAATSSASVSSPVGAEQASPKTDPALNLKPIDTGIKTLQITQTSEVLSSPLEKKQTLPVPQVDEEKSEPAPPVAANTVIDKPQAEFKWGAPIPELRKGMRTVVPVWVKTSTPFRVAILALNFDGQKVAVRSLSYGDIFGEEQAKNFVAPYINANGKTFVSLSSERRLQIKETGILAYVEIEALVDGKPQIAFDAEAMNVLSPDGVNFALNFN